MYSLRDVEVTDLQLILQWRNRPEIREKMYTTHEISWDEHQAYFNKVWNDDTKRYLLCIDDEGHPVGVVNFADIDRVNNRAFWGFYSGDTSKRGVGTQMELLALTLAFDEMHLHKLSAEVLSTNQPVLDFHLKFGFQLEGTFRQHHLTQAGYVDVHRIGLLRSEWESKWRDVAQARASRVLGESTT